MGFSQAFLDWEEATEAKGISIGEALLDFGQLTDLTTWLDEHRQD